MQPALIITGAATSSSDAFSSTFVTFAMNPQGSTRPQGNIGKPPPRNNDRSENAK